MARRIQVRSSSQTPGVDRFNKKINRRASEYIGGNLLERLRVLFAHVPKIVATLDPSDPHTVSVSYPAAFEEAYLRPQVRLEIGPLASWTPSAPHTIRPYASEDFPRIFNRPSCRVIAIDAERTFWEKATILHQQAHRSGGMPSRYSRHYYDLHRLAMSPVKEKALSNLALLDAVVEFKRRFYPSARARYDLARPGSFRLVPNPGHLAQLENDYRQMTVMIFGEAPAFHHILGTLVTLEADINRRS